MLRKLLLVTFLINSLFCAGQKKLYRSYNYFAFLAGERTGQQLTTIHGLEKGSWFAGAGTGLDRYELLSLPVFLSGSKYLFPSSNNLLFTINAGMSFPLEKKSEMLRTAVKANYPARPFGEAGFVYRFQEESMKKGQGILLGVYYSYKGMRIKQTLSGNCPNPPCADTYEYINYELHRWAFKLGLAL
ncbi:hypothetical protein LZZ85_22475 [Terrimonas sp. NA20]|uniref:Outer membrane protein beta-barrel domain-containing protein n=1 Tax=Terrimonas ginsenosidimutans TaxID=2908004 RepID=A0ABS9KXX0_9BACT|nr:hypothetical protein [Terrimonas ginsenosidimutans]MCG2617079.1 hypothetical protein [Terrimonas ginsenosidimutans]